MDRADEKNLRFQKSSNGFGGGVRLGQNKKLYCTEVILGKSNGVQGSPGKNR